MKLENAFDVPVGIKDVWSALTDIEGIVPCMPGATLTETVDTSTYRGAVSVRLGPVALSFNGTASFAERDDENFRALVKANGTDAKGRGNVAADITFFLHPERDGTRVSIETDLQLSGMVAQYGRGAGMIADVASHWIDEFASCLRARLSSGDASLARNTAQPENRPVPVLGLGFKVVWRALVRGVRRLFRAT